MKNACLPLFLSVCAIVLVFFACTLDKEPEIPIGVNNITNPVFLNAEVTTDTFNHFQVIAELSDPGNLDIQEHGWEWSETPGIYLPDNKIEMGSLTTNSFDTVITGLAVGKIYYLRPFVRTGADTTYYGPEQCSFLGVNFEINTDMEIFQGADVLFTNKTPCNNCTYSWDFSDGNTVTTPSPLHTFNKKGNITVRLTATNSGCTATREIVLKVVDDPFQDYWKEIPGGAFIMGCTSEQDTCYTIYDPDKGVEALNIPQHPVTVSAFFMGKTEVTQRQWLAVMGTNPSFWLSCGLDCPVEAVSWDNIVNEFIPALNLKTGRKNRLPTEAEWEYAARADTITKYSGADDIALVAHYFIPGVTIGSDTVAQKSPNKFGLFDMTGNMWEWVEDDYHIDYVGAPANDSAWIDNPRAAKRIARGGGWGSGPARSLVSFRNEGTTGDRDDSWGFRLARSY